MKNYEVELNLFKCEICQRSFRVRDSLDMHTKSFHESNVNCEIDDTFQLKHKLDSNTEKVYKEKVIASYQCTTCNEVFSSRDTLKTHTVAVHDGKKPFKCDFCNLIFGTNQNKIQHIANIHESSYFKISCKFCDATFRFERYLKSHIAAVHPYKCKICNSRYRSKTDLVDHVMKIHVGESPEKKESEELFK